MQRRNFLLASLGSLAALLLPKQPKTEQPNKTDWKHFNEKGRKFYRLKLGTVEGVSYEWGDHVAAKDLKPGDYINISRELKPGRPFDVESHPHGDIWLVEMMFGVRSMKEVASNAESIWDLNVSPVTVPDFCKAMRTKEIGPKIVEPKELLEIHKATYGKGREICWEQVRAKQLKRSDLFRVSWENDEPELFELVEDPSSVRRFLGNNTIEEDWKMMGRPLDLEEFNALFKTKYACRSYRTGKFLKIG